MFIGVSCLLSSWEGGIWREREEGRYFLHVDAVACTAEDEACSHSFCKSTGLVHVISEVVLDFGLGLGRGTHLI